MGLASGESRGPQAAVLPDSPDEPASLGSADDLLSQLAGEEIDRLLAESEAETDSPVPPQREEARVEPAVVEPADPPAVDLRALAREVVEETSAKAAADLTAESDATVTPAAPSTATAPAGGADSDRTPHDKAPNQPAQPPASLVAAVQPRSNPAANEPTIASVLDEADAPLPIYLRPLAWLNTPLAWCSPGVREALGKVAIVTLVNAIAVLLYIMLFRRH